MLDLLEDLRLDDIIQRVWRGNSVIDGNNNNIIANVLKKTCGQ